MVEVYGTAFIQHRNLAQIRPETFKCVVGNQAPEESTMLDLLVATIGTSSARAKGNLY